MLGHTAGGRPPAGRRARGRRGHRRQHLRLHRRSQAGVDRRHPGDGALQGGGHLQAAGGDRLPVPALPQRAGRRDARGRPLPGHRRGRRDRARPSRARSSALAVTDTPAYLYDDASPRRRRRRAHTAYVKIAEGCDRPCAFCIIPKLRGPQRSRTPESSRARSRELVAGGTREISLVAQDLTTYGTDLPDGAEDRLAKLLRQLAAVDGPGLDPAALRLPRRPAPTSCWTSSAASRGWPSTSTCRSSTSTPAC